MTCDFMYFSAVFYLSGRWASDNEWLYAMEPPSRSEKSTPHAGIESGTAKSVGHRLTY